MSREVMPTSIKMLVIDIDGTLLDPDGEITAATLAAVRAAQEKGIIVTLATARRYGNTRQIADELQLAIPLILYDGAMIVQHPQQTILHTHTLRADVAQQAVEVLVRHHIQPVVHPSPLKAILPTGSSFRPPDPQTDCVLACGSGGRKSMDCVLASPRQDERKYTGVREQIWTGPTDFDNVWIEAYFTAFPELMRRMPYGELCTGHPDPLRVVAFASEEAILEVSPEIAALDCSWTSIKRGNYGSAELVVMDAGCSKASGVAALAKYLGIPLEQVMAIGDNNNDIAMLQSVGWGVAMGHAPEGVIAAARAVTSSNREDGAALAIERYALGDEVREDAASAASNSLKRSTCL